MGHRVEAATLFEEVEEEPRVSFHGKYFGYWIRHDETMAAAMMTTLVASRNSACEDVCAPVDDVPLKFAARLK
jgi:hypothetical protein